MKHLETIRTSGPAGVLRVTRPSNTPSVAGRVFRVNTPAEMPELRKGDRGREGQGGLPPVANRTPWSRAGLTGRVAREPFNSRAAKGEYWATKRYLEGSDRQ